MSIIPDDENEAFNDGLDTALEKDGLYDEKWSYEKLQRRYEKLKKTTSDYMPEVWTGLQFAIASR